MTILSSILMITIQLLPKMIALLALMAAMTYGYTSIKTEGVFLYQAGLILVLLSQLTLTLNEVKHLIGTYFPKENV